MSSIFIRMLACKRLGRRDSKRLQTLEHIARTVGAPFKTSRHDGTGRRYRQFQREFRPQMHICCRCDVHMGCLQAFSAKRRTDGVRSRTINTAPALVRHILNLAAS
jgi:hypothetical protein